MNYQQRLDKSKLVLICSHLPDGSTWYKLVFGKHLLVIRADTLCQMSVEDEIQAT